MSFQGACLWLIFSFMFQYFFLNYDSVNIRKIRYDNIHHKVDIIEDLDDNSQFLYKEKGHGRKKHERTQREKMESFNFQINKRVWLLIGCQYIVEVSIGYHTFNCFQIFTRRINGATNEKDMVVRGFLWILNSQILWILHTLKTKNHQIWIYACTNHNIIGSACPLKGRIGSTM